MESFLKKKYNFFLKSFFISENSTFFGIGLLQKLFERHKNVYFGAMCVFGQHFFINAYFI